MPAAVSPSLRKLLDSTIDSIEKLDLVIALHGAPARRLAIDALAARLGFVGREEVRRLVHELSGHGLALGTLDDHVVLVPQSDADEGALAELADLYERDRALLIVVIAESAIERLRELAGRAFTHAFGARRPRDPDDRGGQNGAS
ncbi:MAG: hypothetical protein KF773_27600 [Deltaproteobacteria bacterium]|nr:hypothetical protein [Deltaproteobacteria bacterium]